MRTRTLAFWTAVTAMWSLPALAGEVNGLTTFTAGTPAVASEVNGNFDAVADAVNDNHARLTAVEGDLEDKQDRVTGTCDAGTAMTAVEADGSVTCEPALADGWVAASSHAFARAVSNSAESCELQRSLDTSYFTSAEGAGGCTAVAPLTLPHGAELRSLSCWLHDSTSAARLQVTLDRRPLTTTLGGGSVFTLPLTTDGSDQLVLDTTPAGAMATVDNQAYAYHLVAFFEVINSGFGNPALDDSVNIGGCSVEYAAP